jgi:hypothetical protein
MNATGYKILGYAVWHGGKWYLRRNYSRKFSSARRYALGGGLLALVLAGVAVAISRRP